MNEAERGENFPCLGNKAIVVSGVRPGDVPASPGYDERAWLSLELVPNMNGSRLDGPYLFDFCSAGLARDNQPVSSLAIKCPRIKVRARGREEACICSLMKSI